MRWPALVGVGLVALGARLALLSAAPVMPPEDPAFYLGTALNLISGRGLTVDVVWTYRQGLPDLPRPGHEWWQPLPTFLEALALLAAGPAGIDPWRVAQLPGLLAGTGTAVLGYVVARQVFADLKLAQPGLRAFGVGLGLALNSLMAYHSVSADSSALFSFFALLALGLPLIAGSQGFAAGLAAGLAYLARPHAALIPLSWFLGAERRFVALGILGFVVIAGPWAVRNLALFGTPGPLSSLAVFAVDTADLHSLDSPPGPAIWGRAGLPTLLASRFDALVHGLGYTLGIQGFLPTSVPAWVGLWVLAVRYPPIRPAAFYSSVVALGTPLLFGPVSTLGALHHSAGSIIPWLLIGLAWGIDRLLGLVGRARRWRRDLFPVIWAGLICLWGIQAGAAVNRTWAQSVELGGLYTEIRTVLAGLPPGPVICTIPYTVNLLTGRPALSLPAPDPADAVLRIAHHYGARLVLISERAGRYPDELDGRPNQFRLVYRSERIAVYEIAD